MSDRRYRHLVCIPDGAADEPHPKLGGRTPLDVARVPMLRNLAARGTVGQARTIPKGMPAASDIGIMSILGYDPVRFHTGRAPIEAAALGIDLPAGRVAFRCNLVTVSDEGRMLDFTGGHPTQEEAALALQRLAATVGGEATFHLGLGYRTIMTAPAGWANAVCVPPHEIVGSKAVPPTGAAAEILNRIMRGSQQMFRDLPITANQVWLWGQGRAPVLERLTDRFKIAGSVVGAVAVARGLGRLAGLDVADAPGTTGWYDTSYEAKRDAVIDAFEHGADLVVVHIAATDEAGHAGDLPAKIEALENWDARLLAGLIEYLRAGRPWRLLWIPDHVTATLTRAHTSGPVPYVIFDSEHAGEGGELSETAASAARPTDAADLFPALMGPG